jgi:hypothetical protein
MFIRPGLTIACVAAITVAGTLVATVPAAAATGAQVTVVGGAAVPTRAPSTDEVTYTISVGDAAAELVVLHAYQPDGTTASPAVEVDGAPAPADTVDQVGNGLRIRLGTGADAAHGGTLDIGNHTISFDTQVTTLPQGSAAAYAVVDYAGDAATKHVTSPRIPLALPDIALTKPSGSGESRILPLGTGVDADFEAILSNSGGSAAAASLTIALPRGMKIDRGFGIYRDDQYRSQVDTGGTKLRCATVADHLVRCALGAVRAGTSALLDIPVQPTAVAPVGHVGTFAVTALANNKLEARRGNNTVHGSVRFTGIAHLVVKIAPRTLRVPVGHTGRLVVAVHNAGPNPALRALAVLAVRGGRFTIVRRRPATVATARGRPLVLWNAGTIPTGRTARSTVTLRAVSAGRDELLVATGSAAGDPPCEGVNPTRQCKAFAYASLVAVRPIRHRQASRSPATYTDRRTSRLPTRRPEP